MKLPNKTDSHVGTTGWCLLGIGIVTWDMLAHETLTHAFQRGMEHPIGKFMLIGVLGATAAHLSGIVPPEYDLYYAFGVIEPYETR